MGSPEKPLDVELGVGVKQVKVEEVEDENVPLKAEFQLEEKRFTGLKRDELMEVANQPKWRRARWILFVLFWVLWVGMLAAAVLIVINAPKCKPVPITKWYQDTVLYKVDPNKFAQDNKGMIDHMKYIRDMKTSLLLSNVMGNDMDKPAEDEDSFKALVENAHQSNVKVIVEMKIDSLPTTSDVFKQSSSISCDSSPTPICRLFEWNENPSDGFTELSSGRKDASYYRGTNDRAIINYNDQYAHQYLKNSLDVWLKRWKVDGFYLTDLSQSSSNGYNMKKVVETSWELLSNQTTQDDKHLALFVEALGADEDRINLTSEYSVGNKTLGETQEPVIVYTSFDGSTFDANLLKTAVKLPRSNGLRACPALKNNADVGNNENQSLSLTMINLALPGIPIIQSGAELGNIQLYQDFQWKQSEQTPISVNENSSVKFAHETIQDLIKKRIADTLNKPSLRYDTQDQDTVFYFAKTGTKNVAAFCRKWYKKAGIMVVSNLVETEQLFNIDYEKCDSGFGEQAEVLVSSDRDGDFKAGSILQTKSLESLPGYTTIIITTKN